MGIGGDFNESAASLLNGGSIALPLPSNDDEIETVEGYLLVLRADNGLHPSDARRIQFLNRFILMSIEDDDSKPSTLIYSNCPIGTD